MFFVDRGITLGDTYYTYMAKHFTKVPKKMGTKEFTDWLPNDHTIQWVRSRLEGRHYRVLLRDCGDLPPITVQVRDVFPTPEQKKAYKAMSDSLIAHIKDSVIEASTALVKLSKLRQITGGYVFDGDKNAVALTPNPKLDAFLDFITDLLVQGEQVVVFAVYTEEIKALLASIPGSVGVYGGISDKDKFANVDNFIAGKAPVIVCQPQSAGHALTFVNARYLLFYSIDYSAEMNYQAIKRIERITQKRAMFVYYFLMVGTIDKTIYKVLHRKISSQSALIDGLGPIDQESALNAVVAARVNDERLIIDTYLQEQDDEIDSTLATA
jgi:SNF2 family DNA or RNA helicase